MKNIIYLDEQKLYSLSSQLFEGVTDYVLNESSADKEESHSQRGPFASNHAMADVLSSAQKKTEMRYLKDHAFNLFSDELVRKDKVLIVGEGTKRSEIENESEKKFVKSTARVVFNDGTELLAVMEKFHSLQYDLKYIGIHAMLQEAEKTSVGVEDRASGNKKSAKQPREARIKQMMNNNDDVLSKEYMASLKRISEYGYAGQFLTHQAIDDVLVTSCMNRDFLRESESLIVDKYGRVTSLEIVVFGVISQGVGSVNSDYVDEVVSNDNSEASGMKSTIIGLIGHMATMELAFKGKFDNELVVDPIAVYIDI